MAYKRISPQPVVEGGTGAATLTGVLTGNGTSAVTANAVTQHGVLLAGASNAVSSLGVAATGATLMGSTGADPAFTGSPSFSGSVTAGTTITASSGAITATSGDVVITSGNLTLPNSTASVGLIKWNGSKVIHNSGSETNIFVGKNAGNTSVTGTENACFGERAGTALTSGGNNVLVGPVAGGQLLTGGNNTLVGYLAGFSYTGAEANNVILGFNINGTVGESNVIRIGNSNTSCFISGINGISVTGTAVLVSAGDQLGVAASSIKFKENVVDMADEPIMKLRPVNFNYIQDKSKDKQWGLIAEEVNEVMPDLVVRDKNGEIFTVQYLHLIPILLKEVQKLRKDLDTLRGV